MERNDNPPKLILNGTHKTEPPPPLRPEIVAELDGLMKLTNEAGQSVYIDPAHVLCVGPTNDLRLSAILMAYGGSLPTPHKPDAIAAEWSRALAHRRALQQAPMLALAHQAEQIRRPSVPFTPPPFNPLNDIVPPIPPMTD